MKAKLSIKKALSLIVVLVMLLTMIPAGMISVGAEEATIDLSNYDFESEYVIMNVEDWLLIAREAQDKDFSGKTVKLGADLDFGAFTSIWDEAHVPASGEFPNAMYCGQKPTTGNDVAREYAATVPTLFNDFAGVFDGEGYTISNARFEEGGIAKRTLDGAEVKNVNFENVNVTDFYDYFAFGIVAGEVTGSFWMENVHLIDSSVLPDLPQTSTVHHGSAGALIGLVSAAEGVEDAYVGIFDCSVEANVACGNYKTWGYGYGTGLAIGTVDANVDFEMAYCSFGGSVTTIDWYAGVIGALYVGKEKSASINDVTVDGLSVVSTRNAVTNGIQSFGALVGCLSPEDNASVTIDRITVTNTSMTSDSHALGGLIGVLAPANSPEVNGGAVTKTGTAPAQQTGVRNRYETTEDVSITISNIYTDVNLWVQNPARGGTGPAGLIGQLGEGCQDDQGNNVMTGEVNIYNIFVTGSLLKGVYDETKEQWNLGNGASGLIFHVSLSETVITVSNVVIDATFPVSPQYMAAPENYDELVEALNGSDEEAAAAAKAELDPYYNRSKGKLANCISLIMAAGTNRQAATGEYTEISPTGYLTCDLYASDIATTLRGDFNVATWLNRYGGMNYNGEHIGRGKDAIPAPPVENDGSIVQVRPIEARQMVQFDDDGYITRVTGALGLIGVQAEGDDIRFIASAYVDSVASATATVTFTDGEFNAKTFTFDAVSLLDGLTAVEGTDIAEYDAADFYAKKLMAVTIKNIPADTEYAVEWSFEYVTEDGITVTSETATGVLKADGSFELR